jgi:hypothetical protein
MRKIAVALFMFFVCASCQEVSVRGSSTRVDIYDSTPSYDFEKRPDVNCLLTFAKLSEQIGTLQKVRPTEKRIAFRLSTMYGLSTLALGFQAKISRNGTLMTGT